jgi:hypothetical protein
MEQLLVADWANDANNCRESLRGHRQLQPQRARTTLSLEKTLGLATIRIPSVCSKEKSVRPGSLGEALSM